MAPFNFASSAKVTLAVGTGQELAEEFGVFAKTGLDEILKHEANTPIEGQKYFKMKNVSAKTMTSQGINGLGLAQLNADASNLPFDKRSVGFQNQISNHVFRLATSIEREALETDQYGALGQNAQGLMHSSRKTIERIYADAINRGFGTTDLALLCEDGLGMFSAGRNQPKASAGTWSNLEATGALTADAIAAARLNFKKYLDGNGDLDPQMLNKVIVSPDLEDTMRKIAGTTLEVDTSLNNTNIVSGIDYEVWNWLDSDKCVFAGDAMNGLQAQWRKGLTIKVFEDGGNPDMLNTRVRWAMGIGCDRNAMYRGLIVV